MLVLVRVIVFLGEAHRKQHDYEKALVDLTKAMTIQENIYFLLILLILLQTYDTIAITYTTVEIYDLALNYYNKVLKIQTSKTTT